MSGPPDQDEPEPGLETFVTGRDPAGLDVLEASLPGRARCIAQIAYVLAVMLAPSLLGAGARGWAGAALLAALGVVLVRPWQKRAPGLPARIAIAVGVPALVLAGFAYRPRALLASGAVSGQGFFSTLTVRDLCLLGVALLLVLSDGQRPRQLGLQRRGLGLELAFGLLVLGATYVVHLAAALPLSAIAFAVGGGKAEMVQRTKFLHEIVGWAEQVRPWTIPLYMGLAGAFEEIVFRGLFITRLRRVFGRWWPALLVAAALFGLGHLEEGTLAAFQTAILGIWFGTVFIRRKRLESVIVAHALFNTIMFAIMIAITHSGLLDAAQKMLGH